MLRPGLLGVAREGVEHAPDWMVKFGHLVDDVLLGFAAVNDHGPIPYPGEFEVPAIDGGKARVKVPSGTQSGRRFRLTGKGMPVLRSKQTGDMYVQVMVETPQNLTKRQRELLNEFEKLSSQETQPEAAGFFAKVKEFFGTGAS